MARLGNFGFRGPDENEPWTIHIRIGPKLEHEPDENDVDENDVDEGEPQRPDGKLQT